PGRALHQVVDRSHDDQPLAVRIQLPADVAVVRARQDLRLRVAVDAARFLHQADERLLAIHAPVDLPQILVCQRLLEEDVGCRQDAAHRLDAGHGEVYVRRHAVDGQLLQDLGAVPVPGRLEGAYDPGALRVVA